MGWSNSTAGRAFALHAADPGLIPPSLSESPASYREYPDAQQSLASSPWCIRYARNSNTSLTMETLLVPTQANQ